VVKDVHIQAHGLSDKAHCLLRLFCRGHEIVKAFVFELCVEFSRSHLYFHTGDFSGAIHESLANKPVAVNELISPLLNFASQFQPDLKPSGAVRKFFG